jgi:Serine dehydrogenase proteinase
VVFALLLSFTLRLMRQRRLREVTAPRPQASGGQPMASLPSPMSRAEGNGRKVISIIHDFGHPHGHQGDERRYLSTREAFEILAEIRSVSADTPIDVVLHTPGGEAFACELIAMALKDRPNTTAYVPYCAMSAGTIIALATEKIVMGKYACLGPIDTQFFGFPIESYTRLLREKPIQSVDDFTILLGYLAEKELRTARQRACELLNRHHFGKDDACQLTDFLVAGDLPHSEQISRERAIELGVNITNGECPPSVYNMVEERLRIYKSMDESDGFGPDFAVKGPRRLDDKTPEGKQDLRAAAFASPRIMWRKP